MIPAEIIAILEARRHEKVCFHEAGHVIVSEVVLGPPSDAVSSEPEERSLGRAYLVAVHHDWPAQFLSLKAGGLPKEWLEYDYKKAFESTAREVIGLAGGAAAGRRFIAERDGSQQGTRTGCGSDRRKAFELMKQLVPDPSDQVLWWRSLNRVTNRVVAMPETWTAITRLARALEKARRIEGAALAALVCTPEVKAAQEKAESLLKLAPPRRCRLWRPE